VSYFSGNERSKCLGYLIS